MTVLVVADIPLLRGRHGYRAGNDRRIVIAKYSIGSKLPGQRGFWGGT
jgi:hypothetical protein